MNNETKSPKYDSSDKNEIAEYAMNAAEALYMIAAAYTSADYVGSMILLESDQQEIVNAVNDIFGACVDLHLATPIGHAAVRHPGIPFNNKIDRFAETELKNCHEWLKIAHDTDSRDAMKYAKIEAAKMIVFFGDLFSADRLEQVTITKL